MSDVMPELLPMPDGSRPRVLLARLEVSVAEYDLVTRERVECLTHFPDPAGPVAIETLLAPMADLKLASQVRHLLQRARQELESLPRSAD